jgi:hypothetical protein
MVARCGETAVTVFRVCLPGNCEFATLGSGNHFSELQELELPTWA